MENFTSTSRNDFSLNLTTNQTLHTTTPKEQPERSTHDDSGKDVWISEAQYEQLYFIIYSFIVPSICFIGIVGNGLGFGVLLKTAQRLKMSVFIYIIALTLSDTLFLITGFVRSFPQFLKSSNEQLSNYIEVYMSAPIVYLDGVFTYTSAYLILTMSIERYFAIARPLKITEFCMARFPAPIVTFSFIFNAVFYLPVPFLFQYNSSQDSNNETVYYITYKEEIASSKLYEIYNFVKAFVLIFIPFLFIVTFNLMLMVVYRRMMVARKRMFTNGAEFLNNQMNVTLVILTITVMYVLLTLPQVLAHVLSIIDPDFDFDGKNGRFFWLLNDICNVLTYSNAAIDFIVYVFKSKIYREIFKKMYLKPFIEITSQSDSFSPAVIEI